MNPKCLVDVVLCAWPPSYMKSLARKQYPNAVIGTRYPNAVIWLVRDKNPNAAIWLVRDTCTYPNVAILSDAGNILLCTLTQEFFLIKNNWKMRPRNYFNIILDFELRCSTNWSEGIAMCSVSLWKASFFSQVSSMSKAEEKSLRKVKFQA